MRLILVTGLGLLTGIAAPAHAMTPSSSARSPAPLVQQIERTCNLQGVCWNKYTGEVERPIYRREYYAPRYRERGVYREDYAPRRRYQRSWDDDAD